MGPVLFRNVYHLSICRSKHTFLKYVAHALDIITTTAVVAMASSAPSIWYWFTSVRSPVIIAEQETNAALMPIINSHATNILARGPLTIICSVSPVSRSQISPWYGVSLNRRLTASSLGSGWSILVSVLKLIQQSVGGYFIAACI